MNKKLLQERLDLLLTLVEETQPDMLDDNYLFQPHHWKVQEWIDLLEKGELNDTSNVMKDANAMWSFRNRFKNGELDVNKWPQVEVEETIKDFLIRGQKINAIKYYRQHKIEDMNEECGLKEAKEYIDSLQDNYQRLGML
tara:strand:+ start:44 stop:463 length:420 start_codon:yes stop_codon:yes gene_type:complete